MSSTPTVNTLINSSNCTVLGNSSTGNALSVQQVGAGNVFAFSNASGGSNVMVMNNLGRVGIGTASPGYPLDVNGTIRTTAPILVDSIATGSNYSVMRLTTGGDGNNYIQSAAAQTSGSTANLIFSGWFGGGESMRLTSTGRLGIGTANPGYTLQVTGGTATTNTQLCIDNSTNASTGYGCELLFTNNNGGTRYNLGSIYAVRTNTVGNYSGALVFSPSNNGTATERMRIMDNGNVGIGTVSPQTSVNGVGPVGILTLGAPQVQSGNDFYGNYLMLTRASSNTYASMIGHKYLFSALNSGLDFHVTDNSDVSTSTPKMTIRSSGNVGIGTVNPVTTFHVGSATGFYGGTSGGAAVITSATAVAPLIAGQASTTSAGNMYVGSSATYARNTGGGIIMGGRGYDFGAGNNFMPFARISGVQRADGDAYDGDFVVETMGGGSGNGRLYERMRIASTGNVGIGTASPGALLDVYGGTTRNFAVTDSTIITESTGDNFSFVQFRVNTSGTPKYTYLTLKNTAGSNQFWICANNSWTTGVYLNQNATSWSSSSDARLKDIIEPISNAVSKVEQINPVIYSLKSDETKTRRVGVIAQDVYKVLPEAVDSTPESEQMMGVAYTSLVPLALAAIKELSAENTALKTRLDSIEQRLAAAGL